MKIFKPYFFITLVVAFFVTNQSAAFFYNTNYIYNWSGDHVVMDCAQGLPFAPEVSYSWGVGVDNLLACTLNPVALPHVSNPPAAQALYAIRDRLGSVMGLVDSSGSIVARYDYDAWGNPVTVVVSSAYTYTLTNFRFRWQCREYVPLISDNTIRSGLYYFRNRWYDPVSGRFLSKDPIGLDGGDLNLYVFCNNDPVNFRDPYGLSFWGSLGRGFIGAGTGALSGAASGAAVGAGVGAIVGSAAGGVGALPGAGAGAVAGATAGVVGGAISGFINGAFSNSSSDAAISGAISGAFTGATGGAGAVGGIGWGVGVGTVSGFSSTYISTGDVAASTVGGLFGGLGGGIGGMHGGLTNSGVDFYDAFISGIATADGEAIGMLIIWGTNLGTNRECSR